MKKSQFFLSALLISAGSLFAACKSNPQPGTSSAQVDQTQSSSNQQMMQPSAGCSSLTPEEQSFAYQLTPRHQMMFCSQFSEDQRTQAMQMAGQPMPSGGTMSADQAVQHVMQSSGMTPMQQGGPMTPMQQGGPQAGGACPVK